MNKDTLNLYVEVTRWFTKMHYATALTTLEQATEILNKYQGENSSELYYVLQTIELLQTLHTSLKFPQQTMIVFLLREVAHIKPRIAEAQSDKAKNAVAVLDRLPRSLSSYTKLFDLKDGYEALSKDPIASIVKVASTIHRVKLLPSIYAYEQKFDYEQQNSYIQEIKLCILPMIEKSMTLEACKSQANAYKNMRSALISHLELLKAL